LANHFVAVSLDSDDEPAREFKHFTEGLERLADSLAAFGNDIVPMESMGAYWITIFGLCASRSFTAYLINARHVKNVSDRTSDVLDWQWTQQLMSYGLPTASGRPCPSLYLSNIPLDAALLDLRS
jgi:hypothetical protein